MIVLGYLFLNLGLWMALRYFSVLPCNLKIEPIHAKGAAASLLTKSLNKCLSSYSTLHGSLKSSLEKFPPKILSDLPSSHLYSHENKDRSMAKKTSLPCISNIIQRLQRHCHIWDNEDQVSKAQGNQQMMEQVSHWPK